MYPVAVEDEEFDRAGLLALTEIGVGKLAMEVVDGEGLEAIIIGPGWISPNSPGSKIIVEQNPSVDVIISIFPSEDLKLINRLV